MLTPKFLRESPCCNAVIERQEFDGAMRGTCAHCKQEVDRVDKGNYIITSVAHVPAAPGAQDAMTA